MCGIFGYVGKKTNAATIVLEGLKALEYRGYDSWGVAAVPSKTSEKLTNIVVKKKVGKIGDSNVRELPASDFSFGHTRWATHGGVTDENAHPHLDCTKKIAIIHNGIVENYEHLKTKLVKNGHVFVSDTDSEVIAHLIEEYGKTMIFTKAVQRAFNQLAGLNAIIVMKVDEHKFVAARNGSPLVVGFNATENYIASDAAALLPHTRQVHFLEDEQMAIISDKAVMLFNVKTGDRMMPKKQHLDWSIAQVEKGKYPYYMLKEIHEQPALLADIAVSNVTQAMNLAKYIKDADDAYIVGCGSSSYVGIAGSYMFSKVAKRHINWAVGSEFSYQLDFLTPKSLVIALSQSGETMDIIETIKKAKEKRAKIFALVNVLGSTLYRMADYKMLVGAGPEKAVASTKALTSKLAHLVLLSYAMIGKPLEGQRFVTDAAKSSKAVLPKASVEHIKELAERIYKVDHIYVIGRGLSYPAALETAIKIKEIAYIHAEGMPAGELKHGPLALVEKGTPCIAFLPNDETYGANLAGAMEMKARGGYIIGISHKPHEIFDWYIPVKDAHEATIIPNVIVGQALAYYLTMKRGFDPDKPRNLAKSVTVK
jgi:glucosamine--fructose-6-phosphate aminotransferase (isomerizing)